MFRIATSTSQAAVTTAAILALCLPMAVPRAQTQTGAETQTQSLDQDSATPERLARALQDRYQGIRDFSANFVHTYRGGVLRTQTTERGTVVVKKPGQMRWVYTAPERKEFVLRWHQDVRLPTGGSASHGHHPAVRRTGDDPGGVPGRARRYCEGFFSGLRRDVVSRCDRPEVGHPTEPSRSSST